VKDRVLQSSSLVRLGGGHDQIQAVAQGVLQSEAVKKKKSAEQTGERIIVL